jgi:hypothetical protein
MYTCEWKKNTERFTQQRMFSGKGNAKDMDEKCRGVIFRSIKSFVRIDRGRLRKLSKDNRDSNSGLSEEYELYESCIRK